MTTPDSTWDVTAERSPLAAAVATAAWAVAVASWLCVPAAVWAVWSWAW